MSNHSTIFISAYRGVSIRYILYSDIFKTLRAKGIKIVVFLKDNDLDYYREQLGEDENLIFEPVLFDQANKNYRTGHVHQFFVLVRKCMSGGTKGMKNSTDEVRLYYYGLQLSGTWKAKVFFKGIELLARIGKRFPIARKSIVQLESWLFPGQFYDPYFEKYRPQLLLVSSLGYMIDPYFMRAAKRHGCQVASIIHSWDNPTTKDYRGADPNYVIVWNEIMKQEVHLFHDILESRIFKGGIAHWDFYFNPHHSFCAKEEFLKRHQIAPHRKIIFYGTSGPNNFPRTLDGVEALLQKMEEGALQEAVHLLVRLHPGYFSRKKGGAQQTISQYEEQITHIQKQYGHRVTFNWPMTKLLKDDLHLPVEDLYHLADILHHADVMLTEYSTLMIEGAIFDLPIINVSLYNYRDTEKPTAYFETYTHIKRILQTGACKNAYTLDQVIAFINEYLANPKKEQAQRKRLVAQEITTNPGIAGESIGKYLLQLIEPPQAHQGAFAPQSVEEKIARI